MVDSGLGDAGLITVDAGEHAGLTDAGPGTPAAGPVGYFFGPIGSQLDLGIGSDALAMLIADAPADQQPMAYFLAAFQLQNALSPGGTYAVTLGTAPANQRCKVFMGATGTGSALMTKGAIRAGCEWQYDYVSRSSDNSVYDVGSSLAIGGSSVAIGAGEAVGEGRVVAFVSSLAGLAGNTSGRQVFVRDRLSGQTVLVSHAPDGTQGDADSFTPALSADGLSVIFQSYAKNLVTNDTNNVPDIFVWSALDDSITRVSVGPNGEEADGESDMPTISGDGKIIAFETNATTITPETNALGTSSRRIVRIDRTSGVRTVVTRAKSNGQISEGSNPWLSEDGKRLVFQSFRDLTGDINTYAWDIFVYDHSTGATWPVSLTSDGAAQDGADMCVSCGTIPAISGDGKWVTYASGSNNLVPGLSDDLVHYFLVEIDACQPAPGTCHVMPVDVAADGSPADVSSPTYAAPLSYDGRYVSFASVATNLGVPKGSYQQTNVFVFDRTAAPGQRLVPVTTLTENSSGTGEYTAISRNGAYVALRADGHLDPRFDARGTYAAFTGLGDAFWWYRDPLD